MSPRQACLNCLNHDTPALLEAALWMGAEHDPQLQPAEVLQRFNDLQQQVSAGLPCLPASELAQPLVAGLDGLDASFREKVKPVIEQFSKDIDPALYAYELDHEQVYLIGRREMVEGPNALASPSELAQQTILLHRDMALSFDAWKDVAGIPDLQPLAVPAPQA